MPAVESDPANDPPASPIVGQSYLVGIAPTAEWSDFRDYVATCTIAGWRFIAPVLGMTLFVKANSVFATFRPGGWEMGFLRGSKLILGGEQVIGPRAEAIADPTGGISADNEARMAIGAILATLRQHGLISA